MSAKPSDSPAWISQLSSLDAHLRAAGFSLSPDRWVNIGDLLLGLRCDGLLPQGQSQVRQLLSPLICKSAREQKEFAEIFSQWWADSAFTTELLEKNNLPVASTATLQQNETLTDSLSARKIRSAFIALIALAALFFYWQEKLLRPGLDSDSLNSDILSIDTAGNSASPGELPEPLPTETDSEEVAINKGSQLTSDIPVLPVSPRSPPEKKGALPPIDTLSPFSNTVFYGLWALLVCGFPLICLLLFSRGALRQMLRKKKGEVNSPLSKIRLLLEHDNLFDGPSIRKAIKRLHSPSLYSTRRLQAEKTVDASVRHAGLFTPVYAERAEVPEVMLWINNRGRHDPIQALANTFFERLRSSDLRVHTYSYQKSPERLLQRKTQQWLNQLDVISQHPHARIVIVASAENLFDDSSGEITQWLQHLSREHSVVVLETSRFQPHIAKDLRKNGIYLAPFSSVGINYLFCEITATPFTAENQVLPLLPDVLANAVRWRVPVPPNKQEKQALLNTMEAYLGDKGFKLFTAATAYPEFRWALVRALDLRIYPDDLPLERESRLLSIAQLPWSRDGWLPDWLRLLLLRRADKQTQREIREHYEHLIINAESDQHEVAVLPIRASEVSSDIRGFVRDLFRWCRKGSALEDGVFVELMLGKRLSRLDFELPRALDKIVPLSYTARNMLTIIGIVLFSGVLLVASSFLLSSIGFEEKAKQFLLAREGRHYPVQAKFFASEQSFALLNQLSAISQPGIVSQQASLPEMKLPGDIKRKAIYPDATILFQENYENEARWLQQRIKYLGYGMTPTLIQVPETLAEFSETPIYVVLNRNFAAGKVFRDKVIQDELVPEKYALDGYSVGDKLRVLIEDQLTQNLESSERNAQMLEGLMLEGLQAQSELTEEDRHKKLNEGFSLINGYQQLFNQSLRDVDYLATFASKELIDEYGSLQELKSRLRDEVALDNRLYNQELIDLTRKQLSTVPVAYLIYAEAKHLFLSQNLQRDASNLKILDAAPLVGSLKRFFSVTDMMDVPSHLTRDHYQSFEENYIPLAVSHSLDRIRALANNSNESLSSKTLFADVKAVYIDDYIDTWQKVIDTFVVGRLFQNTRQAGGMLDSLLRGNSNIFRILISTLSRQFYDESLFDAKINRAFEKYQLALASDKYEPDSQVDQLWAALEPTFELAQEKLDADEPLLWAHQFALAEFSNGPSELRELLGVAQNAPQPLRRWMLSVLEQFWRAQLNDAQRYIELQWEQVFSQCKANIEGKFPVRRDASEAVSLGDFAQFFGEGGIEDKFSKEYIEPYISPQSNTTQYGYMLFFDLDALKQSAQADKIRQAYFRKGSYSRHDFRVRFTDMSSQMREVTLLVDKKSRVSYRHGPRVWKSLSWQPHQNSAISLSLVDIKSGPQPPINNSGGWSLLRFFQFHGIQETSDARYRITLKSGNSETAQIEIQFQDESQLLQAFLQPRYTCVERLFLGAGNG